MRKGRFMNPVFEEIKQGFKKLSEELTELSEKERSKQPEGKDFIKYAISKIESGEDMDVAKILLNDVNQLAEFVNYSLEINQWLLFAKLVEINMEQEKIDAIIDSLNLQNSVIKDGMDTIINTRIKSYLELFDKLKQSAPSIVSHIHGKSAAGKRNQEQKKQAKEYAMKRWSEDEDIPQEVVAAEFRDKFNSRVSIRSICTWISEVDPYKLRNEKRKRKAQ